MGNYIEVNDTLQITEEQGFPVEVFDLESHVMNPVTLSDVMGRVFSFQGKPRARVYHLEPVRVFLVQNIDGKWLFWGHAQIQSQTISKVLDCNGEWTGDWETRGTYIMSAVYDPVHQKRMTILESPPGRGFFTE